MPELSSSSTDAELFAAYEDACGYEITGSVTLAQQLIQAARMLLVRLPRGLSVDGVQITLNADALQEEMQRARRFVAAARSSGRARQFDLRDVRE